MRLPVFLQIDGKGRAVEGRRLAAQALLYKMGVTVLIILMALLPYVMGDDFMVLFLGQMVIGLILMAAILWSILRGYFWVAAIYALYSTLDLFAGLSAFQVDLLSAALLMIRAVLSFVFICGVVIWFRNRSVREVENDPQT